MPAAIRDLIDTRSKRYASALEKVQGQIVKTVDTMLAKGMSADEVVRVLGSTDFAKLAGAKGKAAQEVAGAYREVLAATVGRHSITDSTLAALQSFTRDSFLAKATEYSQELKGETIKALLAGGRTSDVAVALRSVSSAHAGTLAATGLSTFSRSVGAEMAKQDPPDMLYEYEGPVDDVTRDLCLDMAAAGPLTRAEIEERWPGAFVDGGGFNCRHSWEPSDAAVEVDQAAAQAAIEERGDTWREPVSVRVAMEEREARRGT